MSKYANKDIMVAISLPPFWHCGRTIRGNSIYTLIALAPAMLAAFAMWGLPAIRVVALSVFTAMACEFLCQKAMGQKPSQHDGTAAVLGVLFAFLLPAAAPWWLVVIGVGCAMCLGRMAFGGYGTNPVSAVLVGWALVFVSFPTYMDATSTVLMTDLFDPLLRLKQFGAAGVADISCADLLLGLQLGGLGAVHAGLLFLGGLFVIFRGVIRWEVPLTFLIGVAVTAACFRLPTLPAMPAPCSTCSAVRPCSRRSSSPLRTPAPRIAACPCASTVSPAAHWWSSSASSACIPMAHPSR